MTAPTWHTVKRIAWAQHERRSRFTQFVARYCGWMLGAWRS